MTMYVLSLRTQQGTKTKRNMFFSFLSCGQPCGGEGGNVVANRRKALGRLEAAMNQTKD